jgi:hypothetical protein
MQAFENHVIVQRQRSRFRNKELPAALSNVLHQAPLLRRNAKAWPPTADGNDFAPTFLPHEMRH